MKIALLGNMNNNNFAMMRYFRDLGADAHLLLFRNDYGKGMTHFMPENDSWNIEAYRPFIHYIDYTINWRTFFLNPKKFRAPLDHYDYYIGSGMFPALFHFFGLKLNIFYPYGIGIEYVGSTPNRLVLSGGWNWNRIRTNIVRYYQIKGIRSAQNCLNAEMGLTKQSFEEIGVPFIPLPIPMVYANESTPRRFQISDNLQHAIEKIRNAKFSILSHSRLMWKKPSEMHENDWSERSKNNHWLINSFCRFHKEIEKNSILVLFEYGPDVEVTKKLVEDLSLSESVIWLPTMPRKIIMLLISYCTLAAGEFIQQAGLLWGGTGWEVMASGKPLLQTFNFTADSWFNSFGHEPPPILDVKNEEYIYNHLIDCYSGKTDPISLGKRSKKWFQKYNGEGLAKKWLDLLKTDKK